MGLQGLVIEFGKNYGPPPRYRIRPHFRMQALSRAADRRLRAAELGSEKPRVMAFGNCVDTSLSPTWAGRDATS